MGNRAIYADFTGKITKLEQVFGEGNTGFKDGDKFALYKVLAYLDYLDKNEPKNCSVETGKRYKAARHNALRLCQRAMIQDLVDMMVFADRYVPPHITKLPEDASVEDKLANFKAATEYKRSCGTEVLYHSYMEFKRKLGGQHIDFRSYVEAAARASLKAGWKEDYEDVLLPTKGSEIKRIEYLIEYAQRLGFVVDDANDADGNVAVVLVGMMTKATSKKVVTKSN